MNIREVVIHNFLSHKNTRLEFPSGLTGIVGLNGSGKSSLIKDSITWALWGKSRASGAGDDLIHYDEDKCSVTVRTELNGIVYQVHRERIRGSKTKLSFAQLSTTGQIDISCALSKDTQEKINKVFGMSYDVFRNSCCIEQGDADSFSKLSPQDASKILLNILQLDRYPKYKAKSTDKYMEIRVLSDKLETENQFLLQRIQENENLDSARKAKESELTLKKTEYQTNAEKLQKAQEQYDNIKSKLDECYKTRAVADAELVTVTSMLKKFEKQLEILGKINGKCPICESALTSEHKSVVKDKFSLEVHRLTSEKATLESKVKMYQEQIRKYLTELDTFKLSEKSTKLSGLQAVIASLESEIALLKSSSAVLVSDKAKLERNKQQIENGRKQEEMYSELASAFGTKGIPLLIIDNMLRELEILVNENLKFLSDLPLNIELKTQREGVSGDLIDTFQIMINEGITSRPYFNYSGGERLIIDLSIRLGLSELLARRNNFKVETLIIDEGLGSLDENNQLNLVATLRRLSVKFNKILVITHTQAKDYFDNYIEVTKNNRISEVICKSKNSEHKVEISK